MDGSATPTPEHVDTPRDPVARAMMIAIAVLVIAVLASVLAYTLSLRSIDAPRTASEHEILLAKAAVDADPQAQANYLALAVAYAQAGRTDDALDAIELAYDLGESPEAVFTHADVLRAGERLAEAIPIYDHAERLAIEAYEQTLARLREARVIEEPANTLLARVLFGRGLCKLELGESAQAVDDLQAALKITPTDAALLVSLGDAQAAEGDAESAKESYSQALVFVPDYAQALEGLADLGVEVGE